MIVKRDIYLNRIIERQNNGMVKVITGIRRCGKSFLLFRLYKEYLMTSGINSDHIIEIALDGIESEDLRDPKTCYNYIKERIVDNKKYYVLLDEVQFLERFEEVLNSLLRIENVDVYVTGSNSYGIFLLLFILAHLLIIRTINKINILDMKNPKQKMDYLKSIFDNVYMKDVIDRNKIKNRDEINTLVDILASAIGSPTNPTKIANTFATERNSSYTNKTVSAHIDCLEEAYLISKANRYDIKGRKYIAANLKYYFTDVGLRNARLNFRQQEPTHLMENIVYNELLAKGYLVDVGIVEVNRKNAEGKSIRKQLEVDFVTNMGNQRYYIQVAYDLSTEEKQKQEFNSFRNIPDSFKKIILVNGSSKPWRNEDGYVIMGMKYFLLNENSLEY